VIALAVMGSLVLVYGWNSFFLAPRNRAKAAAVHDLSAARTQEQTLKQNLAQLKKLAADTKTREAELVRLGGLVPADPDVAGAILALNDTANQAQVAWSSFVPSTPSAAGGGPVAIGISMKVGGSFSQVFDYLRRLELLDRLVVIDSLQLAGGSGTSGRPGSTPTSRAACSAPPRPPDPWARPRRLRQATRWQSIRWQ
jgi:Tfp pilus assembly protein PilO